MSRIEEMQGAVRAHNLQGVRMDGGGDDRPPVYEDEGVWVYRASSVGACERALWYARTGVPTSPTPQVLSDAYLTSANNEELALAIFEDRFHIEVEDRQKVVEVEVAPGVVVRGSVDGIGGDSVTGGRGIVEVKCLGPDYWERRGQKLLDETYWGSQIQTYMRAADLRLCWVVWGRKVDGVVEDVDFMVVERDPRKWAALRDKVLRVEDAAAGRAEPPVCAVEQFGCPYWQLHEGQAVMEVADQALAKVAFERDRLRLAKARLDDEIKMVNARLDALMTVVGEDKVVVSGRGFGRYRVTKVTQNRITIDHKAMRADGVDVDRYTTYRESSYWKVTDMEKESDDADTTT